MTPIRLTVLGCVAMAFACLERDRPPGACGAQRLDAPLEIEVVYRTADGQLRTAAEMEEIPLLQPPQGGKVLFIGVRARNAEGCTLTITTALVDRESGAVVALERRPILLEPDSRGWIQPAQPEAIINYSNLPACPRASLDRSIEGEIYHLRVAVEDRRERRAEATLRIVPRCGEPELSSRCQCECSRDYVLGSSCDGG
jgi:hypothetical protein